MAYHLKTNEQNPTYCPTILFLENTDNHKDIGETRGKPEMNNHSCVHVHL